MHRSLTFAASALVVSTIGIGAAQAQQAKPEDVLALRKGVYQVVKASFGPMAGFADGKVQLDAAKLAVLGTRLGAVAPMAADTFPAGSDLVAGSKAKPEIWSKPDDFKAKMGAFQAAAAKLADLAKAGNLEGVKAQVPEVGKTCKACHDDYKEK
ncbi:MAG: cytochrome c [Alphaproteobacteria bacterium]|nr:cytochrome c [Alphaproteobacteria bacterium]